VRELALFFLKILHALNKLATMRDANERKRKVESYRVMMNRVEKGSFGWTLAVLLPFFLIGLVVIVFIVFLVMAK